MSNLGKKRKRHEENDDHDDDYIKICATTTDDDDDEDHLSSLPDCLLSLILSLLPLSSAARTTVLSSRFRLLFPLTPLHIDYSSLQLQLKTLNRPKPRRVGTARSVTSSLLRRVGSIPSFRLHSHSYTPIAHSWIQTLTHKGIKNLDLSFNYLNNHHLLPHPILRCKTLTFLKLKDFDLSDLPRGGTCFPNLRECYLFWGRLSEDSLEVLLSGCRFLGVLRLRFCSGIGIARVRSGSLRELVVDQSSEEGVVVEDAPELRVLGLDEGTVKRRIVRVLNSPKMEGLHYVNADARVIRIGEICIQANQVQFERGDKAYIEWLVDFPVMRRLYTNLNTRVNSVKCLAVAVNFSDAHQAKVLASLLQCFPCLEILNTVIIHNTPSSPVENNYWEKEGSSDCLAHHLKKVQLTRFHGNPHDLVFSRFLIRNARVLKVMSFLCVLPVGKRWKRSILRELGVENRACLDAQVTFMRLPKCLKWEESQE